MPERERKKEKEKKGGTLYDYLDWRGDISFEQMPPNEVDCLIFALLTYIPFDGVVDFDFGGHRPPVLLAATKAYLRAQNGRIAPIGLMIPKSIVTFLVRAAKTPRFGLCRPCCFVNKFSNDAQLQFCAMSYLLPGGATVVCFRGTDDTIVGWKENFNMSFMHPVPAQKESVAYLENIAKNTAGPIYTAGHSKGGNLAVYSYVRSCEETRSRVVEAYNYDGPGFDERFIRCDAYMSASHKIRTVIPQSSIIGMLLENDEKREVVRSTATGLLQHNAMTWSVMRGSFLRLDEVDEGSRSRDKSLKKWLSELTPEQRESFIDSLYDALTANRIRTLTQMNGDKARLIKAWNSMTPEARTYLGQCIRIVLFGRPIGKGDADSNE